MRRCGVLVSDFKLISSKTLFRPPDVKRIQTDGSFSHRYNISRTAVLVTNTEKEQYMIKTYLTHRNSYESEWQSVLDGIVYSLKKDIGSLELENDNLSVVNTIISMKQPTLSYAKPYMSSIIAYGKYLDWFSVRWVPRGQNKADKLFDLR